LVVDYSGVLGLPPFNEGDFVEVKGTNLDSVNKILEATELELETYLPPAIPGYHMEIEGIITQVTSPSDFEVNGQRVFTDGATVFENGTSVDIAINVRVEVEGTVDENSILIANEVEFKYE
jgi:hypothetical protein